ncbi:hypothetical protein [Pseudoalteromonas sp.]|uniref:hypothetical protein n=1 Tax=Pseudoalteromonas TaxID=53246 RepID=UPI003F9DF612
MSKQMSKQLITQLRKANQAVVRFDGIAANLEVTFMFHGSPRTETLDVTTASAQVHVGCWCFLYLSGSEPTVSSNFSILTHLLKPSDTLELYARDNSTQSLSAINYETVQIVARVVRRNSKGEHIRTFDFVLDSQTIEKNCIARNITRI